jgi:hypothetical protein
MSLVWWVGSAMLARGGLYGAWGVSRLGGAYTRSQAMWLFLVTCLLVDKLLEACGVLC